MTAEPLDAAAIANQYHALTGLPDTADDETVYLTIAERLGDRDRLAAELAAAQEREQRVREEAAHFAERTPVSPVAVQFARWVLEFLPERAALAGEDE